MGGTWIKLEAPDYKRMGLKHLNSSTKKVFIVSASQFMCCPLRLLDLFIVFSITIWCESEKWTEQGEMDMDDLLLPLLKVESMVKD